MYEGFRSKNFEHKMKIFIFIQKITTLTSHLYFVNMFRPNNLIKLKGQYSIYLMSIVVQYCWGVEFYIDAVAFELIFAGSD